MHWVLSMGRRVGLSLAGAALVAMSLGAVPALAAGPGLDPSTVDATLAPGGTTTITKTVHTPQIAPKADIYFLADTTGSMTYSLSSVQTNATAVMNSIATASAGARFGAGDYKDFPSDSYAFRNSAPIPATDDGGTAALAAINAWWANGGNDTPEGELYALDQIADNAANFRTDSSHIVVWFGDAPGHDPICKAISGLSYDITEQSVIDKLVAAKIRVVAISLTSGGGLDADPASEAGDYGSGCPSSGSAGQASRITAATGGVLLSGVGPSDITSAILTGLNSLPETVAMTSDCAAPIHTTFDPASATVPSGTDATFKETISVDNPAAGGDYVCKDWATINGVAMTNSDGKIVYEVKTIHVPATSTPSATPNPTILVAGATSTPRVTPPPTNSEPRQPGQGDGSLALLALLFCCSGVGVALLAVRERRQSIR